MQEAISATQMTENLLESFSDTYDLDLDTLNYANIGLLADRTVIEHFPAGDSRSGYTIELEDNYQSISGNPFGDTIVIKNYTSDHMWILRDFNQDGKSDEITKYFTLDENHINEEYIRFEDLGSDGIYDSISYIDIDFLIPSFKHIARGVITDTDGDGIYDEASRGTIWRFGQQFSSNEESEFEQIPMRTDSDIKPFDQNLDVFLTASNIDDITTKLMK